MSEQVKIFCPACGQLLRLTDDNIRNVPVKVVRCMNQECDDTWKSGVLSVDTKDCLKELLDRWKVLNP